MGADTATPGRSVLGRRRTWAWMALAGFAGLRGCSRGRGGAQRGVVDRPGVHRRVLSAAGWGGVVVGVHHAQGVEALAQLALLVLVVVTLVISLVAFSLWQAAGMLAVVVAALAYGLTARQALAGAAPAATVERAATAPARPWLLVNPRSGDGTAGRVGLVDGARVRGISVQELAPGDDPATLAREAVAAGADAVGVAGGDGSLGLVAAVAVEPMCRLCACRRVPATTSPMTWGSTGPTRWPPWARSAARSAASMSRWWATECS